MSRFIFVTGGVVSSLGKGVASASIGLILKSMGYSVMLKKLDPYLNVDPGTMNPTQHGEVFVTEDGTECDLDIGHYERFTGIDCSRLNSITSGKIYQTLIENERKGKYLGSTVQTIPHVTDLIKDFIYTKKDDHDFILCEIGGTVGDIEALPFFEAARQIKQRYKNHVLFVHLTYIPYLAHSDEIKTKPTQHSVKELMSIGIVPDILLCRSSVTMGNNNKRKIAEFCNVDEDGVIEAIDLPSIYSVPLHYVGQNIHKVMMRKFEITKYAEPQLDYLKKLILNQEKSQKRVNIAIVGKYTSYRDSYKSIIESILHASLSMEVGYEITWIEARELDVTKLNNVSGVIVPGGFGKDGIDGKIEALKYCRENNIPTLGICLGMQMMVVEFARNVLKMDTGSEEFTPENTNNVVKLIKNFINKGDKVEYRDTDSDLGGTMRLGSYKAKLSEGSQIRQIYGSDIISERHRHRYEVDCTTEYDRFFESGMRFSGSSVYSGDLKVVLTECIEVVDHPFYIGVQFHPEFKSKLFEPHPLFCAFVETCLKKS